MSKIALLKEKSKYIRIETLKIHKIAPETRIASSLSPIEIFVSLYYGYIINFNPKNPFDENRDRFIISK
jgi:transketolase